MTTSEEIRLRDWQASLAPKGSSGRSPQADGEENGDSQSTELARELQAEFIKKMDSGADALAAYLREKIGVENDRFEDTLELPRLLSAGEVFDPPDQLERELHATWTRLTPRQASQPIYWYRCHIRWLEEGKLADGPYASFSTGGKRKLTLTNDERTRDALRHMGGLRHVRGRASVLNDCPMSRAWWRRRVAEQAAGAYGGISAGQAHQVLTNPVWNRLCELSMRRVTIVSHPNAQAALIAHIVQKGGGSQEDVQLAAQRLAQYGLHFLIASCSVDDLLSELQK